MTDDRLAVRPAGRLAALRIPPHVGVMLGASTAAYAISLAGVTGLQATSEAQQASERAPAIARIEGVAERNRQLTEALAASGTSYDAIAAAYAAAGGRLADLEAALGGLASSVQQIDGVSRSMPSSIALPKVSRVSSGSTAPATSSTTGASGG